MRAKTNIILILAAVFLLAPESLWAATGEAGQEGWGWLETAGRWFNLALLFGVIYHFAGPSIKDFFVDRRQQIQDQMQAAEKARQEAQAQLATVEARLAGLDTEIAGIRADSERQVEAERNRILEQAENEASKILTNAEREVQGMTRAAMKDLKRFASHMAVEMAEGQIRKDLTAGDDSRMIDEFFSSLREQPGGERPS